MAKRKGSWTAPLISAFRGTDARPSVNAFESLSKYLAGSVGVSGSASVSTNAYAVAQVTHNAGFIPSAIIITRWYETAVDSSANMGQIIVVPSLTTATTFTVVLNKADGTADISSSVPRNFYYLLLPPVNER